MLDRASPHAGNLQPHLLTRTLPRDRLMPGVRLILALHNHQPVGNFDGVFDEAYRLSYGPFLDVLEDYPEIAFVLHTSGPLLEWLVEHEPGYVRRLRGMVEAGRVEILGGRVLRADPDDDPPPRPDRAGPRLCRLPRRTPRRPVPEAPGSPSGSGSSTSPRTWPRPGSNTSSSMISTSIARGSPTTNSSATT